MDERHIDILRKYALQRAGCPAQQLYRPQVDVLAELVAVLQQKNRRV